VFTYAYDALKRLYTVSVGGNVLRTHSYDTNPYDANYSQYSAGRLTAIQYAPINYAVASDGSQGSTTFTDMFSYAQPGSIAGKRLRVTKTAPYPNGQPFTATAVGDAIVTSEDVTRQKPAPDIFLEAARRIGVPPKYCRAYEDTDLGLQAIKAAGMEAVDVRELLVKR